MSEPEVTTEDVEATFEVHINELVLRLEENAKEAKTIANELKVLKKDHNKIVKKIAGTRRKKVPKDPNAPKKAPSGFAKPTKISAKLAAFLGVSEGEMIARPDVTKGITKYVKDHKLQKEENKRIIDLTKPGGDALVELLKIPDGEELTFFNLQKYLKIHFPVSEKVAKEPKEKTEKAAPKPRAKKAAKEEEDSEEAAPPVKETKKRATKKVAEPEPEEVAPAAPVKATRKTAAKKETVEETPAAAPVKATKASKAKQAKAEPAEEVHVDEEAPAEEVKPRRRRRVEETS